MPTVTYDKLQQELIDQQHLDPDDLEGATITAAQGFLTEMSAEVKAIVNEMGMTWDDAGVTYVDRYALERIANLTEFIQWCWHSDLPIAKLLWTTLGLRGDDDYDYSAGYIAIIVDAIREAEGVL